MRIPSIETGSGRGPARSALAVHATGKTKVVKELGQGTERTLQSEFAFDNYGNQTLEANYGVVENGNVSAFDDERIVTNQFALNLSAWIVRLPSRKEIREDLCVNLAS